MRFRLPSPEGSDRNTLLEIRHRRSVGDARGALLRVGAEQLGQTLQTEPDQIDPRYLELGQMLEVRRRDLEPNLGVKLRDLAANDGHAS
jgi:hypothetical protein